LTYNFLENIQISSTDQRRLVIYKAQSCYLYRWKYNFRQCFSS